MEKGIKEILELEKQADSVIKKAEKKAEKIISDAKKAASEKRLAIEDKLAKQKEEAILDTERKLKKRREQILAQGEAEKDRLVSHAQKNMDKAVSYLIGVLKTR